MEIHEKKGQIWINILTVWLRELPSFNRYGYGYDPHKFITGFKHPRYLSKISSINSILGMANHLMIEVNERRTINKKEVTEVTMYLSHTICVNTSYMICIHTWNPKQQPFLNGCLVKQPFPK